MADQVSAVKVHHTLHQIMHKGGYKHRIKLDVHVLKNVIKGSFSTVFSDQGYGVEICGHFYACADETVDIVMAQLPH